MPLNTDEVAKVFELIEKTELNKTLKESLKGAQICGVTVFASCLCFGPVGAICGGIIGGLAASMICEFDSIPYVIKHKLTEDQKEQLLESVNKATEDVVVEDAAVLLQYLKNNPQLIRKLLNLLRLFGVNIPPSYEILYSKLNAIVG